MNQGNNTTLSQLWYIMSVKKVYGHIISEILQQEEFLRPVHYTHASQKGWILVTYVLIYVYMYNDEQL